MSIERDLLAATITPRPRPRRNLRVATVIVLLAIIALGSSAAVVVIAARKAEHARQRAELAEQLVMKVDDHNRYSEEQALVAFLQRQKVVTPEHLARAIIRITRDRHEQRLLASIAVVESRGNPAAIGKRGERGAYQVRPALHGAVPADLVGQTEQALALLRDNTSRFGVRAGVKSYNGRGKAADRYATRVLAYAGEIR